MTEKGPGRTSSSHTNLNDPKAKSKPAAATPAKRQPGYGGRRDSGAAGGSNRDATAGQVPYQIDDQMLNELNIRMSHDEAAMLDMERDFQLVIKDLIGNESLGKFRVEYEKLHQAIKMAHENEIKLMGKCRDLHAEIVANSSRITTATRLAQEDQATIQALKKEIEKAWKMLDEAHEREDKAGETITTLKMEIGNLTRLVEKNANFATGQEHSAQELLRTKDKLAQERDEYIVRLEQAQQELVETKNKIGEIERNFQDANAERCLLVEQLAEKKDERSREERRREKLERELRQAKQEVVDAKKEETNLSDDLARAETTMAQQRTQLRELRVEVDRMKADLGAMENKQKKLQTDYDTQVNTAEELRKENVKIKQEQDLHESEVHRMNVENGKLTKANEAILRKVQTLDQVKSQLESDREILKEQAIELEKRLETQRLQGIADRKAMEDLLRERDTIRRNLERHSSDADKLEAQILTAKMEKHALELEIQRYEQEAQKSRRILGNLEKERVKNAGTINALKEEILDMTKNVNDKDSKIADLKRQNEETDAKTQAMRNQLETIRTERNILSKNVSDANEEIEKYKRRIKIMADQMEQLRDQISRVEGAIAKEHLERQRLETERNTLRSELTLLKKKTQDIENKLGDVESEQVKLVRIIKHADQEKEQMLKEVQRITRERDILGTQVVRRNDELILLSEKIKILESIMEKGEGAYRARLEDIRVLKLELQRLNREKGIMSRNSSAMEEMRAEIYRLNKDLLSEKNHCKTLEEELRIPANAHRWRALQGNDPSTYELILKIQTYQRRLIKKTDEVIQIERMLQEKENLYIELKSIMARLPSQEIYEKVIHLQKALQDKTKQMRGLTADVNMYTSMWNEEKLLNERLIRDIEEYKAQYFRLRKLSDKRSTSQIFRKGNADYGTDLPLYQKTIFYGGGYKTQPSKSTPNSLALTMISSRSAEQLNQEATRAKDTNIAVINLGFSPNVS
ncbi:cilia- and flagella-associated protein 58-like [Paramacrobiotus metropolitanus]|uniref:cilia- and flagella-associated protein 58-like n=1 Tax=Paramacrobiotus metropolitanus TaxID=2943436 RepID=UPI002445FD4C|nr:cilia- and flagella-associated protein 58-like [Paramacrobiotus metropolitanus]